MLSHAKLGSADFPLLRNLPASLFSKACFRSRAEYRRHQVSREGVAGRLQNKMILKPCGQHSILVVDDVEHLHQRLPLDGGERTCGQHVCHLFCGAHILNVNTTVQIDPFKSSIRVTTVTSGRASQIGTATCCDHTNDCFVVLKHVKLGWEKNSLEC